MQLNQATPADLAYLPTVEEDSPDNAPIPEMWTPDHVGRRIVDAYRIDRRMPRIESPKSPGSAHPQIEYSDEDRAGWETNVIEPGRFPPSLAEIATMESVFLWLLLIRKSHLKEQIALKCWAAAVASDTSIRKVGRRIGIHAETLKRRKDFALSLLSARLRECGVPVF